MQYISTRDNTAPVAASVAIAQGMVPEGGLYVPETFPQLDREALAEFCQLPTYQEAAKWILSLFLPDYTAEEIADCVEAAYGENFDDKKIAPLVQLGKNEYILELWHGPTAAFKDMALQLTPRLLAKAMEKIEVKNEVVVLVATSGDTGKAALEGFKDVPGTKIIVFYPAHGVSRVQELQMVTTEGNNTYVVAVEGNFDDCQTAVKEIFANQELKAQIEEAGYQFSSANSINWGRLLPQIVYYFNSYAQLVRTGAVQLGELVDFVVPTGNFGNILAGWYSKKMGLPIGKMVCASNKNNVLTDFFATGTYNRQREFYQTNSPSMDILISSNLERFLFDLTEQNGALVKKWMEQLQTEGSFTVDAATKLKMDEAILAGSADEEETIAMIKACYDEHEYLLDTHTAVAVKVARELPKQASVATVIDSTAHPGKFVSSVYSAFAENKDGADDVVLLNRLSELTNMQQHPGLEKLEEKPVRHNRYCQKGEMEAKIKEILGV